ncbi:hypothetical protein LZ578_08275 [Jeotgalibaca sp. MA1X17-3]|uniref:hypothetical protein n=1 Tax=Jeotgalibaca sp. MA1X17-3 TaxID=2908211 RepID=UPI001F163EB3|nr:hypothetical protein [Jeotgalibaca sp. MA1X17-3]UJF15002.1 hypothetical protein LZ578_08275 [Jeotgalibaca sp. MA1X17-3]
MAKEIIEVRLSRQHTKGGQMDEETYKRNIFNKFNFSKYEIRQARKEQLKSKVEQILSEQVVY